MTPRGTDSTEQETLRKRPVLLLHGLAVASPIMWYYAWRLRRSGRVVHNIGYNSFHTHIPDIARLITRKVSEIGLAEYDAVTHSMGGIVLRWAITHAGLPRPVRAVLTGPPNNGAMVTELLLDKLGPIPWWIFGSAFMQLRPGDHGLAQRAGSLEGVCTGIIAGGRRTARGYNPFLDGDNDCIVAVQETLLPGMADFALVKSLHTPMLIKPTVADLIITFLDHGVFRPEVAEEEDPEAPAPIVDRGR